MKVAIACLIVLLAAPAFACPGDKSTATVQATAKQTPAPAAERAKATQREQTLAQVKAPARTVVR